MLLGVGWAAALLAGAGASTVVGAEAGSVVVVMVI